MLPIERYGIIGDCRSAALVGDNGSIDWLCWPRFDSAPVFWSLLDRRGGRWTITPRGLRSVRRHYVEHTNVLVTEFTAEAGVVRVTDFMPVSSGRGVLVPERELLRIVEGVEGACDIEMSLLLRPEFGAVAPAVHRMHDGMLRFERGRRAWLVAADARLEISESGEVICRRRVAAEERFSVSLSYAEEGPLVLVPFGERPSALLSRTQRWWREWVARARYDGPHRELVLRSVLALNLLTYAPSGAMIAAPTTSLPERSGGDLNWDYRYAWMRDSALTVRALLDLGYEEYALAFVGWLLHTTRLTRPRLRVLYDVYGRTPQRERSLDQLEGWFGSKPVRIGNAAEQQLQMDAYGEVIDAVAQLVRRSGMGLDREAQALLVGFGKTVAQTWREPDAGIWEIRGTLQHFTHSKVLCWVALDRLLELDRRGVLKGVPREHFARQRAELEAEIETRGYSTDLRSYVQAYGGRDADTSLLQLAWYGYREPEHSRMLSTFGRIVQELRVADGLLLRNSQSVQSREAAFGISCFWAVEYLARGGGRLEEAEAWFAQLARFANDLGLYAEEIDPATGAPVGNFPQAFTHVGLINAALSLSRRAQRETRTKTGRSDA